MSYSVAGKQYVAVSAGNTLFAFANTYKSAGNLLNLGVGPVNGTSRYFIVGAELPATASNSLQGQEAQFSMTWGFAQ